MGKQCHPKLSTSVLGNLYFHVTRRYAGPIRVWYFLQVCHVNTGVCSLEVGHTGLANRVLSRETGQSPSGGIFSGCQHLQIAECDA